MDDRMYVYPNQGRFDNDGVEWFACDPYPTWYRWENGELFTNAPPEVRNIPEDILELMGGVEKGSWM